MRMMPRVAHVSASEWLFSLCYSATALTAAAARVLASASVTGAADG